MNTFVYINGSRRDVNVPQGFETLFKGVPFENAQQFETATELAYRANACFNNSILFLSIVDMDRSKKYMEELFEIIHVQELSRFKDDEYDPSQDVSDYEESSYIGHA